MNLKPTTLLLLLTIFVSSCNVMNCPTKEAFMRSYQEFVTDVESKKENKNYDWTSVEAQFKDYADRCYVEFKSEFTKEDQAEFWTNTIKYYIARFNGDISKAYKDAKSRHSDDFEKDLEEFFSSGEVNVLDMLKNIYKDDINKGVDDALEALQNLGDKIKESLEEK